MITVKTKDSTTFISEDNVQVVNHDEKEKTVTVTIDMGRGAITFIKDVVSVTRE